ncbi:MAG: hypothetical protein ACR2FJ_03360 [Qipengyuania sp.]
MDWGGPTFVLAIIALSTLGWLINNLIRAKHGYSLADEIEALRDRSPDTGSAAPPSETSTDSGTPLAIKQTEQAR